MSAEQAITTTQPGKGYTTSASRAWLKCYVRVTVLCLGLFFSVRKGEMFIYCSSRAAALTYNKFRSFVILEQKNCVNFHLYVASWML